MTHSGLIDVFSESSVDSGNLLSRQRGVKYKFSES